MTNGQEERFLRYFRFSLFILAVALNAVCYMADIPFSWVIFLSGILFYMLEGEMKERLLRVTCGGAAGLCGAAVLLILIVTLTPVLGKFFGYVLPLARSSSR